MQNKLYTTQFPHLPMTNLQSVPKQQSWNNEPDDFCKFHKTPEKDQTPWKIWTPGEERIQTHGNKKAKQNPVSRSTPIHKLKVIYGIVWSISIGQLGLAGWLCPLSAPAHQLISWTWETGKSPWVHCNNWKHQCTINSLLILNPKYSSYWEKN